MHAHWPHKAKMHSTPVRRDLPIPWKKFGFGRPVDHPVYSAGTYFIKSVEQSCEVKQSNFLWNCEGAKEIFPKQTWTFYTVHPSQPATFQKLGFLHMFYRAVSLLGGEMTDESCQQLFSGVRQPCCGGAFQVITALHINLTGFSESSAIINNIKRSESFQIRFIIPFLTMIYRIQNSLEKQVFFSTLPGQL